LIPLPTADHARKAWTARQAWRVVLKLDAAALPPGEHGADIIIRPESEDDRLMKTLPVSARVAPLVTVSPGQFFFGTVPAGPTTTREVIVQFAADTTAPDAGLARIAHDLDGVLVVRWRATEGRFWHLTAALTPDARARMIAGEVRVSFDGTNLPGLTIPLVAHVEQSAPVHDVQEATWPESAKQTEAAP
jgi:hypothetical protein